MVSLISDQGYYTFLYGNTKLNRKGGRKEQTNKHRLGSAPSAGRGKWHVLCILWANASVYSQSRLQSWHLLALVNPAAVGQQVLAVVFLTSVYWSPLFPILISWPCPSLDCYLKPTVLFCSLLLTVLFCLLSDHPSLVHFRSRGRSRMQALCLGLAPKQRDRLTGTHTHRYNECPHGITTKRLKRCELLGNLAAIDIFLICP